MLVRAARPIDLVKLRREERNEHRAAQGEVTTFRPRTKLGMHRMGKAALTPSATGILPWWTYEARSIPGVGQAMVNIANLNFLIEANDLDIPAGGLDLAFRRIYNSQSGHDAINTDGSTPSVFGNRWTNNLDVHLGWSSTGQNTGTVSVYTGDGARDDYSCTINTVATCTSLTPGVYEILATTQLGGNGIACQLQWTKKSGTSYMFDAPYSNCTSNQAGYYGRLLAIYGRNTNFYINLAYSWSPDASNPENLATIVATHQPDGAQLTMTFGQIAGSSPPITELMSITLPDNETVNYHYSSNGEVDDVDKPGNTPVLANETMPTSFLDGAPIARGNLPETYDIGPPGLMEVCGPRATISNIDTSGHPTDGACVDFDYSSHQLSDWYTRGVLNPTPQDNVLSPSAIQSGENTGFVQWDDTDFFNNQIPWSNCTGSMAEMVDAFQHNTQWCYDGSNRAIQTYVLTTGGGSTWLGTSQAWDANNDLTSTTDARGYVTKMGYDVNGNTVEVVLPKMTIFPQGSINPTSFYDYDSYNNVKFYCDPANNGNNNGWQVPADNLCQTYGTNHAKFIFNPNDAAEPYGCLIEMDTFGGYARTINYPGSNCGMGLPTDVTGTAIGQDNNRIPHQKFAYTTAGNLSTYSSYPTSNTQWVLQYTTDGMNRVTRRTDPDLHISSNICYNLDGSVFYSETGWQYHLDGGPSCPTDSQLKSGATPPQYAVAYGYDPDGDVATEARHHNCVPGGCKAGKSTPSWCTPSASIGAGTTCKYYDGLDRLVEVKLPQADSDAYQNPWVTRYLYDLDGSQKSFHGAQFQAYGNLYATQELLGSANPSIQYNANPQTVPNTSYQNIKATAYDDVDRAVAKYSLVNQSNTETLSTEALTWDITPLGSGNVAGLLGTDCNALGQCQKFDYREDGKEKTFESSGGSSPERDYLYDPDGQPAQITSGAYSNPQLYTYNLDGRLRTSTDPSGDTNSDRMSSAVVTHNYYPDGTLESVDVSSAAVTQAALFSYSYRQDGLIGTETINDGTLGSQIKNAGITNIVYTYDNTGRMNNRAETGIAKNATPTTITYDGYGQESSYSSPATSLLNFSYSAEGELLSTTIQGSSQGPPTWGYSLRGELVSSPSSQNYLGGGGFLANGVMIRLQPSSATSYYWDAFMGVQTQQVPFGSNSIPTTWNYSNAGQMNGQSAPWKQFSTGTFAATTVGRTYDAENHLLNTEFSGVNVSPPVEQGISWGPNGHPIMIGTFDSSGKLHNEVLHWDGNQLLFASDGSTAALDDIKIGAQGDILPQDTGYAGLTFYDRGPGGVVIGCHNANASTFAGLGDSWNQTFFRNEVSIWHSPCFPLTTPNEPKSIRWFGSAYDGTNGSDLGWAMGSSGVLGMPRTDGLTDGFDTIQGARSYDNTSGSWTTPDAYAGDVHDPMSQKSFMWNDNNPVEYNDPSGYCIEDACVGEAAVGAVVVEGGALAVGEAAEAVGDAALASSARGFAAATARSAASAAAAGRALAGGVARGIYRFITQGKTYVGRSINIGQRMAQHIRSGKLTSENFGSVQTRAVSGNLKTAEQNAIDEAGGVGNPNVANKINAQGARPQQSTQQSPP